jgi:hypothetical protein
VVAPANWSKAREKTQNIAQSFGGGLHPGIILACLKIGSVENRSA